MAVFDPCAALQAAEQAYGSIVSGQAVREFRDSNGELVSYSNANIPSLLAYMQKLQVACPTYVSALLPQLNCGSQPLRFIF